MNGAARCHTIKPLKQSVYRFNQILRDRKHTLFTLACFFVAFFVLGVQITLHYGLLQINTSLGNCVAGFLLLLGFLKLSQASEESLLLISPLGLQTTTAYIAGKPHSKFIPWCAIQDVVINEAVSGFRMVHYLAVIVKDDSGKLQLVPVLLKSRLRLPKLKEIYCDVQQVLKS